MQNSKILNIYAAALSVVICLAASPAQATVAICVDKNYDVAEGTKNDRLTKIAFAEFQKHLISITKRIGEQNLVISCENPRNLDKIDAHNELQSEANPNRVAIYTQIQTSWPSRKIDSWKAGEVRFKSFSSCGGALQPEPSLAVVAIVGSVFDRSPASLIFRDFARTYLSRVCGDLRTDISVNELQKLLLPQAARRLVAYKELKEDQKERKREKITSRSSKARAEE